MCDESALHAQRRWEPLFGSVPEPERKKMQKDLAAILKRQNVLASSTAGLASVFVALGDRGLKSGGRMALVLPKAVVSGVAWGETRDLFRQGYYLEFLISSHDPAKWNFSDNTDLSEVLLIAKKRGPGRKPPDRSARVTCVNLWRNPATAFEALSLAHSIDSDEAPKLEKTQGAQAIEVSGEKVGEAVQIAWSELQTRDWMLGCSFAQAELLRAAYALITTSKV